MCNCKLDKKVASFTIVWLAFVLMNFSVAAGSFTESEPFAGKFFLVVTFVSIALGVGAYFKYKLRFFKEV